MIRYPDWWSGLAERKNQLQLRWIVCSRNRWTQNTSVSSIISVGKNQLKTLQAKCGVSILCLFMAHVLFVHWTHANRF